MDIHVLFARIAWFSFILVMIIRPLVNIYPKKYFLFFLRHRRFIGIFCGLSATLHVFIYLYSNGIIFSYLTNSGYWNYKSLYFWGNFAFLLMLIPLVTSNYFSQRLLKAKWKNLQILAYPSFVLAGIHISFARGEWGIGFFPVAIWLVLIFLTERRINKRSKSLVN